MEEWQSVDDDDGGSARRIHVNRASNAKSNHQYQRDGEVPRSEMETSVALYDFINNFPFLSQSQWRARAHTRP